jgi:alginate O-acetyltransferase complex protein AlgI
MLFSSPVFLFLFLPVLLPLYFLVPHRSRNLLLLLVSLLFYIWGEKLYVAIMLVSIAANYGLGLWVDRLAGRRNSAWVIALAVAVNLTLLIGFKYANFLVDNLNGLLVHLSIAPIALAPVHLPLGISFFTFHSLSYVIDIYRREVRALKNPIDFALYISFFPQAIAGPIVRYHDVASQLVERVVTRDGFAAGVRRFILGLGKKMLIANIVAVPADAIFNLPVNSLTPGLAWLAMVCYTLQIYFDFSGYSDMAIGLARMFGFQFLENFNYPYISQSITEFWRRWHISLSSWYRDYLYIPLGGNRLGTIHTYFNLVAVFFLCGLWHGASWNFIFWGLFHGMFLVLERMGLGRALAATWAPLRHGYTLLIVMVGWVFFRAASLPQALTFLQALLGSTTRSEYAPPLALYLNHELMLALLAGVVGAMPVLPWLIQVKDRLVESLGQRLRPVLAIETASACAGIAFCSLILLASSMQLAAGTYNPFIYFRF